MKRLVKVLITFACILLACILGLLLLVQSEWAKDKIGLILQQVALHQGVKLKVEKIEGELPLKWTISNLHLQLSDTDTLDIDQLRIRIAFLPLLRGEIGISYLSASHAVYFFAEKEKEGPKSFSSPPSFSIQKVKIEHLDILNKTTEEKASYTISGRCRWSQERKKLDLETKVSASDLEMDLFIRGDKKRDQIASELKLDVRSRQAFAPFFVIPFEIAFQLESKCAGAWPDKPIEGVLKLDVEKLVIPQFQGLDQNLKIATHFSLEPNRTLQISSLSLKSDLLCIKGSGQFGSNFLPQTLRLNFLLPYLSKFSSPLEGALQGDIQYTPEICQVKLSSDTLNINEISFTKAYLSLKANHNTEGWEGKIDLSAFHPDFELKGDSQLAYKSGRLELQNIIFEDWQTSIYGDVALDLPSFKNQVGGLNFQISNLSPYSQLFPLSLGGQIGGTIDLKGNDILCHALGKTLKAGPFVAQSITADLFLTELFSGLKGKIELKTNEAFLADLQLNSGQLTLGWNGYDWNYLVKMEGTWKNEINIETEGHVAFSPQHLDFFVDSLEGTLLDKNFYLEAPLQLTLQPEEISLQNLKLQIDEEGYVHSTLALTPDSTKIFMQAYHFPLDFLTILSPRLSLDGFSSVDIDLQGKSTDLTGHLNFLLERANIYPAGAWTPIETKASFQANLNHDILQIHSHIVASNEQFVELAATFPVTYQLYPFQFALDPQKNLAGHCTIEGQVEQLFDFVNIGSQRFGGFLSTRLVLSGTAEKPSLFGPISIQGGFYKNFFIGMAFVNASVQATANGSIINAEKIEVTDEAQGTCTATAQIFLKPKMPYAVQGTVNHFRVIQFDWLTAACSAPFTIDGNLDQGLVKGTLIVDEAQVHIPDQFPSDIPTLPVTFINQPSSHILPIDLHHEPYPFHYDLQIHGDHNIKLTGRGINADLAGDIKLSGKNLHVTPIGTLQTQQGKFTFAGKDFTITQGEISFTEKGGFINLASKLDLPDLSVTVIFRGSFRSPQLLFQSSPPHPTSSILARILFNKDVSELNASQAVQLAQTIVTLSGGAAPTVLDNIRKTLGIDRLGVATSDETGRVSVQIGKYLMEGVLVTLNQSTEHSLISVEVNLKGGFVLQAETQENDQGKFTFKWNKNY